MTYECGNLRPDAGKPGPAGGLKSLAKPEAEMAAAGMIARFGFGVIARFGFGKMWREEECR